MVWFPGHPQFQSGEDFLLLGFEDLNRRVNSDDDFNDCVLVVTANPLSAIQTTNAFHYIPGDPDGDNVFGMDDYYPNDPDRALITRYPSHRSKVIGLEDKYPELGDADYNDCLLTYDFKVITDQDGDVSDILGTFHLVARGAALDHRVGLHLPNLPATATGSVHIERFLSDDALTQNLDSTRTVQDMINLDNRQIVDLFASTRNALPPIVGNFTNTLTNAVERPAASCRVLIQFNTPASSAAIGSPPYDLYFAVQHNEGEYDIHFPGYSGFASRPTSLPQETGVTSFIDDSGAPWMIEIPPRTQWQFRLELQPINVAYPLFDTWRFSDGTQARNWYLTPTNSPGVLSQPMDVYVPARSWTLDLPTP
jgi:LruC domain-containing protein